MFTYYKGYDDTHDEYEGCEGYWFRVAPDASAQSIHEDDTEWRKLADPWSEIRVDAYEVAADLIPARILAAPTSDHAPT